MTHYLCAEDRGNVKLIAKTLDLLFGGFALLEKVCADGVGVDIHAVLVSLGTDELRVRLLLLECGSLALLGAEINELYRAKTEVVSRLDCLELTELACADILLE